MAKDFILVMLSKQRMKQHGSFSVHTGSLSCQSALVVWSPPVLIDVNGSDFKHDDHGEDDNGVGNDDDDDPLIPRDWPSFPIFAEGDNRLQTVVFGSRHLAMF